MGQRQSPAAAGAKVPAATVGQDRSAPGPVVCGLGSRAGGAGECGGTNGYPSAGGGYVPARGFGGGYQEQVTGGGSGGGSSGASGDDLYEQLDDRTLERLVVERCIDVSPVGDLHGVPRSTLELLLRAYDAGVEGVDGHRRTSRNMHVQALSAVCPTVLRALQLIRDAPGHMGVDIGGTLTKMAIAFPSHFTEDFVLPEVFGDTGRMHKHLELGLCIGCEPTIVKFLSGSTSQMELAVRQLNKGRVSAANLSGDRGKGGVGLCVLKSAQVSQIGRKHRAMQGKAPFADHLGHGDVSSGGEPESDEIRQFRRGWSDVGSSSYRPVRRVATAGGGASKFAPLFKEALRVEIDPVKELTAVVDGLLLLAAHHRVDEDDGVAAGSTGVMGSSSDGIVPLADLFTVGRDGVATPVPWPDPLFPLILVNMGSGVSILRVDSAKSGDYVRVGGTACGGGTFLGLARALTKAKTFEDALALAEGGDASKADKLVSDIYGVEGSQSLGLAGGLTASNFGKLSEPPMFEAQECTERDLARSLLQMVTQQSVLLASAFARYAGCVDRVFFVGGFVDEANHLARSTIADNFRSLGGCAYFLRHSDFLGALGSLKHAFAAA